MICSGRMRMSSVTVDIIRCFAIVCLGVTTKVEMIFERCNTYLLKLYEIVDFDDEISPSAPLFTK